jgi:hypothetical protein
MLEHCGGAILHAQFRTPRFQYREGIAPRRTLAAGTFSTLRRSSDVQNEEFRNKKLGPLSRFKMAKLATREPAPRCATTAARMGCQETFNLAHPSSPSALVAV